MILLSLPFYRFASGTSQNDPGSIDIAAFNVQVFGRTKMSKPFVADKLAQVLPKSRFNTSF